MRPQPDQLYNISLLIKPYEQKIILYMALHKSFIVAYQKMWLVLIWYSSCLMQQFHHPLQTIHFTWIVLVPLQVLLKLASQFYSFHKDLTKLLKLSTSKVSSSAPLAASFMAANVSSLGSL